MIQTHFLKYKTPFDFKQMLDFMAPRATRGVEVVGRDSYARTFRIGDSKGCFIVRDDTENQVLALQIACGDSRCRPDIQCRVRRMFDLDTDFDAVCAALSKDRWLLRRIKNGRVPRLPMAFDPFELAIRAVIGQQISVKAATTVASRFAKNAGLKVDTGFPAGLDCFFPNPAEVLNLELTGLGITQNRQTTLKAVARGLLEARFELTRDQPFDKFHRDFTAIKGIGDWTANYVAMRGLGMTDRFPATDLGILQALSRNGRTPSQKEVLALAEKWRPYRTYAALCLWQSANTNQTTLSEGA